MVDRSNTSPSPGTLLPTTVPTKAKPSGWAEAAKAWERGNTPPCLLGKAGTALGTIPDTGQSAAPGQACTSPAHLPVFTPQAGLAQDTIKGAHTAWREQEGGLQLLWDHSKEQGQQGDPSHLRMEQIFPKLNCPPASPGEGGEHHFGSLSLGFEQTAVFCSPLPSQNTLYPNYYLNNLPLVSAGPSC